jgi:hypothetical protein
MQAVPGSFKYGKNDTWKKQNGGAVKKASKKPGKKTRCASSIGIRGSELQCTLGAMHSGDHTNKAKKEGWTTLWFWESKGANIRKFRYEEQQELPFDEMDT